MLMSVVDGRFLFSHEEMKGKASPALGGAFFFLKVKICALSQPTFPTPK